MSTTFTKPNRPLTWFITGCSSGFGLSLARTVQSNGHNLLATSRNPSRTPDLIKEIESKGGKWLKLDVDDLQSAKVIEELEESGQKIDVLVNNAGFSYYAPIETFSEDEVRSQMESIYFGPSRLIRATVKHMRERRFGIVVNISSGASLEGRESMGAYAAAKAATDAMARVFAKEVAPFNIRVLTVALGTFNTNFGTSFQTTTNPLPNDYKGSVADQTIQYIGSGKFIPDGDQDKAMKAVYEVVVGEGVGKGRENERFLPLGRDIIARVKSIGEQMDHALEVFGDICNNVYIDGK